MKKIIDIGAVVVASVVTITGIAGAIYELCTEPIFRIGIGISIATAFVILCFVRTAFLLMGDK